MRFVLWGEDSLCKKTITNWNQGSIWIRTINNGLSDEEIDYIRNESDLLFESIVNSINKEKMSNI